MHSALQEIDNIILMSLKKKMMMMERGDEHLSEQELMSRDFNSGKCRMQVFLTELDLCLMLHSNPPSVLMDYFPILHFSDTTSYCLVHSRK